MKIRFLKPATARLTFAPGDELTVELLTPELESVLNNSQIDGARVACVVDEGEDETAVMGRGRRRVQRPEALSR